MPDLTPRERTILRLLACGYSNQQIAERTGLSVPWVKKWSHAVFAKLGVTNRTQATLCALMDGTVKLEEAYNEMLEAA